ncbi:hypothetical protein JZ751_029547 [Albula glossodonta]|uniref:Uncharacterized protein n=1 Tax=Albula glossodonta TaxID=121402 RepID=A0A8T2NHW7_9TELE|nr:hypothetical protein JZ751_029547 [Albula glossodonta]
MLEMETLLSKSGMDVHLLYILLPSSALRSVECEGRAGLSRFSPVVVLRASVTAGRYDQSQEAGLLMGFPCC